MNLESILESQGKWVLLIRYKYKKFGVTLELHLTVMTTGLPLPTPLIIIKFDSTSYPHKYNLNTPNRRLNP